jgi:hypothetical protein
MLLLSNEAVNSLYLLYRPLMFRGTIDKKFFELKLYDVVCLVSTHRKSLLLNPLNTELNPICYLLALLGAHHFLHISRIRVNEGFCVKSKGKCPVEVGC